MMTQVSSNNVQRLLSQYTFIIDGASCNDELTCTRCKKLMIDPYQTHCGCQYCRDCIIEYVADGDKCCRGGKVECNDEPLIFGENVFKSAVLSKKISNLKVHCPNQSCTYVDGLSCMEDHLRLCTEQSIQCPYSKIGCDSEPAPVAQIVNHLNSEILRHSELLMEVVTHLRNEVGLSTKEQEWMGLDMAALADESICTDDGEKEEWIKQMEKRYNVLLWRIKEQERVMIEDRRDIKQQMGRIMAQLEDQKKGGRHDNEEIQLKEFQKEIAILRKEMAIMRGASRPQNTSQTTERSLDGSPSTLASIQIDMVVDAFSINKASKEAILSPYFYSHINGYKLRLQIYPGGRSGASGAYLSIYIFICKGSHDDTLSWPCMHSINIGVVNQKLGGIHHNVKLCHSTAAENWKYLFDKPADKDNISYGRPKFISHEDLHNVEGLVVDDSLVLRCVVSPP